MLDRWPNDGLALAIADEGAVAGPGLERDVAPEGAEDNHGSACMRGPPLLFLSIAWR